MQGFFKDSGTLSINLQALSDNYNIFKDRVDSNVQVAGVVKANAYGLGLQPVVETLVKQNCPQFFVATLDEAIGFRAFNQTSPVAVLGGLFIGAEEEYVRHNILPVLNTPDEIDRWHNLALQQDQKLPAIIHFDTGMNRLGLSADEGVQLCERLNDYQGIDIRLIMSHFACADDKDHPMTAEQADRFAKFGQHFPTAKKSLANSPGLFRSSAYHYDIVRPGYALYGGNPTPETKNPMKSVVSLNTRILQIRHTKKGETIGYGATRIFDADSMTATVALGYADGFIRSGSDQATLYYNGQPCPVLGRVSMDLITIGIGHLEHTPQAGDAVEVLGENQSVDDLADACGTIGYEILTSLKQRYRRQYLRDSA